MNNAAQFDYDICLYRIPVPLISSTTACSCTCVFVVLSSPVSSTWIHLNQCFIVLQLTNASLESYKRGMQSWRHIFTVLEYRYEARDEYFNLAFANFGMQYGISLNICSFIFYCAFLWCLVISCLGIQSHYVSWEKNHSNYSLKVRWSCKFAKLFICQSVNQWLYQLSNQSIICRYLINHSIYFIYLQILFRDNFLWPVLHRVDPPSPL